MIPHNKPSIEKDEMKAVQAVLDRAWLAQGAEVCELENELCEFFGLKAQHAVALSSGTAALYMSLRALGAVNFAQTKGSENENSAQIALPSYTCTALFNAIKFSQNEPLFLDIQNDSPNISAAQLNESTARVAIVPHTFGVGADIGKISPKIAIIEDGTQAFGLKLNGRLVGTQGVLGVFSLGATKFITGGGGGLVISKDKNLIDFIRDFREFDCRRDKKPRFNFQMSDLQACIARAQLKKLPRFISRRDEIFARYVNAGLDMLWQDKQAVRFRAVMRTKNAHEKIRALEKAGIKTIVPIEDFELLKRTPNAHKLTRTTLSLPIYPHLRDDELNFIIKAVQSL